MSSAWVFVRHDGEILLCTSDQDTGHWRPVVCSFEDASTEQIRHCVQDQTGLPATALTLVRAGDPLEGSVSSADQTASVTPYLVESDSRTETAPPDNVTARWVPPTDIHRRETIPGLWRGYDSVRPTVETITADTDHGSAWLSVRALEVLRDEATLRATGEDSGYESVRTVTTALLDARPAMTVVTNRLNRVIATAFQSSPGDDPPDESTVARLAHEQIEHALAADTAAARIAADHIDGERVATISKSGTVLETLRKTSPDAVLLPESRPGGEGVDVAVSVAGETDVTLTSDAGLAHQLARFDASAVIVGADAILADGRVVNKVGTRGLAVSARWTEAPVYVVAASDKISPRTEPSLEERDARELYDGPEPITVANPTFDVTPPDAITGLITERGLLSSADVESVASEHAEYARWQD